MFSLCLLYDPSILLLFSSNHLFLFLCFLFELSSLFFISLLVHYLYLIFLDFFYYVAYSFYFTFLPPVSFCISTNFLYYTVLFPMAPFSTNYVSGSPFFSVIQLFLILCTFVILLHPQSLFFTFLLFSHSRDKGKRRGQKTKGVKPCNISLVNKKNEI